MILTRRLRRLRAGSRHGATAVAAVMLLVLAFVYVHPMCSAHLNENTDGAAQAHEGRGHGGEHPHGGGEALAVHDVAPGQTGVVERVVGGSSGCSDHETVTAKADPLLPSLVMATTPERTALRLAPAAAHQDLRTAPGVAAAAAPSLRALGINRT